MRGVTLLAAAAMSAALAQAGCAAAFRESKPQVSIESDPPGGTASVGEQEGPTPLVVPVKRSGLTAVRVQKAGFAESHGLVRKRVNGWWLTADLATCILPVLACIPLLVDAITGAWLDVEPKYRARLIPAGIADARARSPFAPPFYVVPRAAPPPAGATAGTLPAGTPSPGSASGASAPSAALAPPAPASSISESERKASARAAYQEGVELQSQGNHAEALSRFQLAQRVFDAPTHLLHIGQCLVSTGKLVEAQEAYETLTRRELAKDAPLPFREALDSGRRELAELRPRIPTLRIELRPAPSTLRNLALSMNGQPLPTEVLGIARPVNPGTYRITATAWGTTPARPVEIVLQEGDAKTVDVKLGK